MTKIVFIVTALFLSLAFFSACNHTNPALVTQETAPRPVVDNTPEYFNLRPALEKEYGYTHAVRIGNDLKISGAVSMDDSGKIVAAGNMEQQMKNCYADLGKILEHYGYTFDDVYAENICTTDMGAMEKTLDSEVLSIPNISQQEPGWK